MTHDFRPAKREKVQLIIGGAGASGSGKTYSLLELAVGLAYPEATTDAELNAIIAREGRNRIVGIDTERGRMLHYAPPPGEGARVYAPEAKTEGAWFPFDHALLEPPFSPDAYTDIAEAADGRGYAVILVDSGSHEWAGEGGVLEMQEAEFQRLGSRDSVKMTSWIKPKMRHKRMIGRLTTLRAHLLIALRAEEKVHMVPDPDNPKRTKIIAARDLPPTQRWTPVCDKAFPYELGLSFVLTPDEPGRPFPLKLQDQHKPFFPVDRLIGPETGRLLAAWASGARGGGSAGAASASSGGAPATGGGQKRTPRQLVDSYIAGLKPEAEGGKVDSLEDLAAYQARATKFLGQLRDAHPDLHQECVEANSARFQQLSRDDEDGPAFDGDELFPSEGQDGAGD